MPFVAFIKDNAAKPPIRKVILKSVCTVAGLLICRHLYLLIVHFTQRWLHGGWFQLGDASQDAGMDPTELISTGGLNAVFVAIGYRLNIFGFLAGSALLEDSDGDAAGNSGLWDQRVAMEWVRENIHFFGGDAGKC